MKCEFLHDADGTARLTVVFESRVDMDRFKEVYDKFADLLPASAQETAVGCTCKNSPQVPDADCPVCSAANR